MNHVSGHSHPDSHLRTFFVLQHMGKMLFGLIGLFSLQYLEEPLGKISAPPCASPESSSYYKSMVRMFQLDMYQAGMSNKVRTEGLLNAPTSTAAACSISMRISILLNVMQMAAGRSQLVRMRSR